MSAHPEDRVVDEIAALMAAGVDENGIPLDDHHADRYPKCPGCKHDWHGIECLLCGCKASKGEEPAPVYVDQVEVVRYIGPDPGAPWLPLHHMDENQDGAAIVRWDENVLPNGERAYTIADLEAMRSDWRPVSYRQQHVRFWARNGDGSLHVAQGVAGRWHVRQDRCGDTTVTLELISLREIRLDPDDVSAEQLDRLQPVLFDGVVLMEAGIPDDGFRLVGYLDDVDLRYDAEFVQAWDYNATVLTRERYEVVIRASEPSLLGLMRGAL